MKAAFIAKYNKFSNAAKCKEKSQKQIKESKDYDAKITPLVFLISILTLMME